jgi:2-phospho-L-lactate transferase/gluconeogenesis factor (CofD/UPF0052 family)
MKVAAAAVKIAIEQQLAAPEQEVKQNVLPATHHPLYLVDDAENLMAHNTDDTRIKSIKELAPPMHLVREFPCTDAASETTFRARDAIHRILHGADDRLLVVIGPCSIMQSACCH